MPVEIVVPDLGESIIEATVARWLKQEGERVMAGEALVELETDKVNLEVGAEQSGILARIQAQEGQDVQVGDVLGLLEEAPAGEEATPAEPPEEPEEAAKSGAAREPARAEAEQAAQPQAVPGARKERITPVARRLAQEEGVDLARVQPSTPGGRVTKSDVQRAMTRRGDGQEAQQEAPRTRVEAEEPAAPPRPRAEERVRMSRRRRTIAQRLVEAQRTAAMLTTFNEVDMSSVMALRARRKEAFKERYDVSLGIASFFVKAVVGALKDFPRLNAEIEGDEIVLKHYYDIGMAVGAPEGLVVPVLRDADRMSFVEIERAIRRFVQQAEDNTLSLADLRGGTFTITNGGVFGSLLSTPILNPPQVGILGLHKIEQRPVAVEGEVVIRPMMYVALSYDHRIVDGREAVQFLVRVRELIEDPEALLLEG